MATETIQARVTGRTIVVQLPTGQRYLVLQVSIDCPDSCQPGTSYEVLITGHHLPLVKQIIDEAIAEHPDLTIGCVAGTAVSARNRFEGVAPADPTRN